jgi:hypothetical protein
MIMVLESARKAKVVKLVSRRRRKDKIYKNMIKDNLD